MRIRSVSYAAIAIAGGFGFAAAPAFAQGTPATPPAIGAPTLLPATPPTPGAGAPTITIVPATPDAPPAPTAEPPVPPTADPMAPPPGAMPGAPPTPLLGPIDGGAAGGRMMMPVGGGTGPRAEILAMLMAQFHTMDADGDGRLTSEEFAAGWEGVFMMLDQNADGVIDAADRAIAAQHMAEMAADDRAHPNPDDRAATGDDRGNGGGENRNGPGAGDGERRGDEGNGGHFEFRRGGDGNGGGNFEYRRGGEGGGWGGNFERHENGGGTFFFRFPGGAIHLFLAPNGQGDGHGMPGGRGMPGMGMPGMGGPGGMPFFFGGQGFPGMGGQGGPGGPNIQIHPMPGGDGQRGWMYFGPDGQAMPGGPNIQIRPAPGGEGMGGDDRNGGGTGGWVNPNEDRGGGGTGGWVTPGPDGAAPAAPEAAPTRQASPKPR